MPYRIGVMSTYRLQPLCARPRPVPVRDLVVEYQRREPERALLNKIVRE
jgi:hypothetical protein